MGDWSDKGERSRTLVLFAISVLASACGNLSQTAMNTMLGTIAGDFGIGVDTGQWLTTGYMLTLGVTVPASSFLMHRFSHRTLVVASIALFGIGSAVGMTAPAFALLLVARMLQAISAGITMPLMQTIAMARFPSGKKATAMGVAGIAMGFAPNIGPTIGGVLLGVTGWRGFFAVLLGLNALLLLAALLAIKPGKAVDAEATMDVLSFVLSSVGFGGLLLGCSNLSGFGVLSPFVWLPLAFGALSLAAFVRRQRTIENPLVDLRVFCSGRYRAGFAAQCFLFASFMGATLVIPLFVEDFQGGTAIEAGMVLLPGALVALLVNPFAGWLVDKVGARVVTAVSGCFLAVGATGMALVGESTPLQVLMVMQGIRAVGVSGLIGPLASWSLSGLERSIVADGSSFAIAARQASASFGTALMVLPVTALAASGSSIGYQAAFGVSAVMAWCVWATALARVR